MQVRGYLGLFAVGKVDDIRFLGMARRDAQMMANHFKYLSNAFPVTLLYIGSEWPPAASSTKDSHPPRPCSLSSAAGLRPWPCRLSWSRPTRAATTGGGSY